MNSRTNSDASTAAFVLLFALIVALGIAAALYGYRRTQQRRKEFAAWAAQNGFSYEIRNDGYNDMPWGAPFGTGFGRSAQDVLTATVNGRPVLCFTYVYKTRTSNGKTSSTQTHWFSIWSTRMPKALPALRVEQEGFFSTIARAIGVHDIEFESEDFNRRFKVRADDRKFAYDVINPQMMQFLLDTNAPGFSTFGPDIVLVQRGKMDLATVQPTIGYLNAIIGHIPGFVWDAQ